MNEILATILLWLGHNLPIVGQHIGYSDSQIWLDIAGRLIFISY